MATLEDYAIDFTSTNTCASRRNRSDRRTRNGAEKINVTPNIKQNTEISQSSTRPKPINRLTQLQNYRNKQSNEKKKDVEMKQTTETVNIAKIDAVKTLLSCPETLSSSCKSSLLEKNQESELSTTNTIFSRAKPLEIINFIQKDHLIDLSAEKEQRKYEKLAPKLKYTNLTILTHKDILNTFSKNNKRIKNAKKRKMESQNTLTDDLANWMF